MLMLLPELQRVGKIAMDKDGSRKMDEFAWHLIMCILIDVKMTLPFIYQQPLMYGSFMEGCIVGWIIIIEEQVRKDSGQLMSRRSILREYFSMSLGEH